MVLVIDNFVAPWLVGRQIRVSLLPLVFGILGGAAVFGVKGLLIGPLIVSIAPTVFELVRRRVVGDGGSPAGDADAASAGHVGTAPATPPGNGETSTTHERGATR
jgi:predicted PurR-regulated permease PerM